MGIGIGIGINKGNSINWNSYWATRYISGLTVVTISGTEQTVTATIVGTGQDGVSFEYSTDVGTTWTVYGTNVNGILDATGLTANTIYEWRARLYKGTHFGTYSNIAVAIDSFLADGNSVFHYEPIRAGGTAQNNFPIANDASGVDSVWWDLLVGSSTLGDEESSGSTVKYGVYKITATTTNYFYTGNAVGGIFADHSIKTLDATHKVQRVLGNHLCLPLDPALRPINRVFDGTDDYFKTAPFTWNQPCFIYILMRQISWSNNDVLFDGVASGRGRLEQYATGGTPKLRGSGSVADTHTISPTLNEWCIIRFLVNSTGSKVVLNTDEPILANYGTSAEGGFTLGSNGGGAVNLSNIEVEAVIGRSIVDTAQNEAGIYNYLNYLRNVGEEEVTNKFDNGKLVLMMDAQQSTLYTIGLPIFIAQGIKTTMYVEPEIIDAPGYCSWAQVKEFAENQCDLQCHPEPLLTGLTVAEVVEIIEDDDALFVAQSLSVPEHIASLGGAYDANTLLGIAAAGKKTHRTVASGDAYSIHTFPKTNKYILTGSNLGKTDLSEGVSVANIEARMDVAKLHKTALIYYVHGIADDEHDDLVSAANLNTIIDYAQAIELDIITVSELYALMNP